MNRGQSSHSLPVAAVSPGRPAVVLPRPVVPLCQLALEASAVCRLHPRPAILRVRTGQAWISWKGEDIILSEGQEIRFTGAGDVPVLSSVGHTPLVVDLLT